jgi:hypothetical protein
LSPGVIWCIRDNRTVCIYILMFGWACSYKLLEDGQRQIVDFQIPGDFLGLRSMVLHILDHSIEPVPDIEVTEVHASDLFGPLPRDANTLPLRSRPHQSCIAVAPRRRGSSHQRRRCARCARTEGRPPSAPCPTPRTRFPVHATPERLPVDDPDWHVSAVVGRVSRLDNPRPHICLNCAIAGQCVHSASADHRSNSGGTSRFNLEQMATMLAVYGVCFMPIEAALGTLVT